LGVGGGRSARGDLEQHDPATCDVPQLALRREHREADDACVEETPHCRLAPQRFYHNAGRSHSLRL